MNPMLLQCETTVQEPSVLAGLDKRQISILVADDEQGYRDVLTEFLGSFGYAVASAKDGLEALNLLSSRSFDLALLDVVMPSMNGLAACKEIKGDPQTASIPVILVSGYTTERDRSQLFRSGADDFISKPFRLEELRQRAEPLIRQKRRLDALGNAESALISLALGIEARDPYTKEHGERLSDYSVRLAAQLGLPKRTWSTLRRAGLLHDIGKVCVPDQVLLKPGPLTQEERKLIEMHPLTGEHICAPLGSLKDVLPIIRSHHEKLDGSGYPDGLRGDEIPIEARIMATVDVYDAMTTARPYRTPETSEETFRIMREEARRGWWDEHLVEEFEGLVLGSARAASAAVA